MARKVICTNPNRCYMCEGEDPTNLVRGRAYTVIREVSDNIKQKSGFILAEARVKSAYGFDLIHCAPHFEELIAADEDIFEMASKPVKETIDA